MGSSTLHYLILLFSASLLFSNSFTNAQPSFRPKALVLPITKDAATLQYLTIINQRTPLVSINVVIDLGGEQLWVDCDNYNSSSDSSLRCGSSQCTRALAKACSICDTPPPPGCINTCGRDPHNTVSSVGTMGSLRQDVFSVQSSNGKNPGPAVRIPKFLFICAFTIPNTPLILEGLASGVQGMAGLGRGPIGLPTQLATAFSFNRKFGICLPSSIQGKGVLFFGNTPYTMLPNIDISDSLTYTPLLVNPVSTAPGYFLGESSTEYFIGVKSIKVNNKPISLNSSLLTIQKDGIGGTKISTVNPYTVLETSIYHALTSAFVREAKLTRVASVAPFEFCFASRNVGSTRVGPAVPSIDLVLQSENVYWRIFGANSMVQVRDGVLCLGFVDGGLLESPGSFLKTPVVIGAHQFEDNFLLFDLAASRLGFSSSLLFRQTTCSNFNFTPSA